MTGPAAAPGASGAPGAAETPAAPPGAAGAPGAPEAAEERRIIVVDDDREMRVSLRHLLAAAGWRAEALSRADALAPRLPVFDPDVVLSDMRMPGMDGLALLDSLGPDAPPVVLISAHGDIPMAVEAMRRGAYSFLEKPYEPRRLLNLLKNAADKRRVEREASRLRRRLADLSGLDRVLLGETPAIRAIREEVAALAEADIPVLLQGETGAGKDVVARALHDLSPRAAGPFVPVNCAAAPLDEFETIMFGRDAPADGGRRGAFARAHGGTLFLDEIAACPPEGQAKLLRALETRRIEPLGAEDGVDVDIRILSAASTDLEAEAAAGRFRSDLLFRLNAASLTLPPLRDRREDVAPLYDHFIAAAAETYEIAPPATTADDVAALLSHHWPGNVRELRHAAERRVLAARRGRGSAAEAIRLDDEAPSGGLREAVAALERRMIAQALRAEGGRMDDVAAALGIGRRTLNEKIVKLGLDKDAAL